MPNGWVELEDNVAALGSMALGARRLAHRVVSGYGVPRADRQDADHRRDLYLERHDSARHDLLATALSACIVASTLIQGEGAGWRERLPKEARWFAGAVHGSLTALREALADPVVAQAARTSSHHCRSGILAAELERPACLYDAVTMLDTWSGYLLAQFDYEPVPGHLTLGEAVGAAGGFPCAVFTQKGGPGFPVIVTGLDVGADQARGFPTIGFRATDLWSRRSSWLRDNILPDADQPVWSVLHARPEVLTEAVEDFVGRALPAMRHSNAHGMFVGVAAMAEEIGVSAPRMAAWLRQNAIMVHGGEDWVPAPLLGPDTVRPKKDRMGHITWQWSPAFVEEIRPLAVQIAQAPIVRGPARPKPQPTDKQVSLLTRLHAELEVEMPEGGYASRKAASEAIKTLLMQSRRGLREPAMPGFG
jgi:hypothetical protein